MNNYLLFIKWPRCRVIYMDSHSYLADPIFVKNGLRIRFGSEWLPPEGDQWRKNYRLITAKIWKWQIPTFRKCMEELANKMPVCGYGDYKMFCDSVFDQIAKAKEGLTHEESMQARV